MATVATLLRQRGAALRQSMPLSVVRSFDYEFCELSLRIDERRRNYLAVFSEEFFRAYETIAGSRLLPLQFLYKPGWDARVSFEEALEKVREKEREKRLYSAWASAG